MLTARYNVTMPTPPRKLPKAVYAVLAVVLLLGAYGGSFLWLVQPSHLADGTTQRYLLTKMGQRFYAPAIWLDKQMRPAFWAFGLEAKIGFEMAISEWEKENPVRQ